MRMVKLEINWYDETDNCEPLSIFVWPEDIKMIRETTKEEHKEYDAHSVITIRKYQPAINKFNILNVGAPKPYCESKISFPEEYNEVEDFYWYSSMEIETIEQRISLSVN